MNQLADQEAPIEGKGTQVSDISNEKTEEKKDR